MYMAEAFSLVPEINDPKILDIGCGTGVPTVWLAENYRGIITAIDTNKNAIEWLKKKVTDKKLENQVNPVNISFFELKTGSDYFDIIIAEGFLNIIGFEQGFVEVIRMIRGDGYFIIHDEYKDHEWKCDLIRKNNCSLTGTVFLDESVWWNSFYKQLETVINDKENRHIKDLFRNELIEIATYKKDPSPFRSIYYVVKNSETNK